MRLKIFYDKSVSENASYYFDKSKKAKKKQDGVIKTIELMKKKLTRINKKKIIEEGRNHEKTLLDENDLDEKEREESSFITKKGWFTKFRWFFTSRGLLAVGGKDAVTNEILIKKHVEDKDLVFHTDAPGSPFFLLKLGSDKTITNENTESLKQDIEEVAQATACYSKAWSLGLSYSDSYYVKPEQVSKTAKSGEYLKKGSFMIYGKRNLLRVKLELGVAIINNELIIAPLSLVESKAKKYIVLTPGSLKKSDAIKKIIYYLFGNRTKEASKARKIHKARKPTKSKNKAGKKFELDLTKEVLKEIHDTLISQLPSGGFNVEKVS